MGSTTVLAAVRCSIDRVGPGVYGVGCSGGADSIALLDATIAIAGATNVVAIAIDHGLQAASRSNAEAVARFARERGASAIVRAVVVEQRASLEAAARDARYAAFDAIADELGLAAIFVGHTARDQAETVLLRILRGTGPAGLAGIPAQRERIVRPLLAIDRATIDAYVAARNLPAIEDPMNADPRHARVRVRNQILPRLREENPAIDQALVRLADASGEWLAAIDAVADPIARAPIDCRALATQPIAIRKRVVALLLDRVHVDYATAHLEAIDRLVIAPTHGERSLDLPGARIVRSYDALFVDRPPPTPTHREAPLGFALRTWQPGDRMRPVRLRGRSRKLSDLFADAKVPRNLRTNAVVLISEATREIAWAEYLGYAFDAPTSLKGWEK